MWRVWCTVLAVTVFLVVGCDTRPSSVLPPERMADVLFDIHRTDAAVDVMYKYRPAVEKQEYYNSVFRKWGTTKEEFDESLDWYATHTDLLLEIYDTLRMRTDVLQASVEAYEFHPDEKPTYMDSIDYFDMWKWQKEQVLENNGSRVISVDSLHFEINDSNYFARGNDLIFDLELRALSLDSATYGTMLICQYADSVSDTLRHTSLADGMVRRYHYFKHLPDSVALCRLQIQMVDEPFYLTRVEVRDVGLRRRYHRYDSPVAVAVRGEVRSARDSVRMARSRYAK